MNKTRIYFGVSLLILAISFNAKAQTCTPSPDCNSLGYTKKADDCAGVPSVKCPFDTSKFFCVEDCAIGSILYSDKSCSKIVKAGKTAIGVVFDTNRRLAVALDQAGNVLNWGEYGTDIPTLKNCSSDIPLLCGTDGKANTSAIIAYGKSNSFSYPAAEYCNRYTTAGTTAGDWFLPSLADLRSIYNAKNYVNASLQLLGKSALTEKYYWSSTELSDKLSWRLDMYLAGTSSTNFGKNVGYYVRAVVAF